MFSIADKGGIKILFICTEENTMNILLRSVKRVLPAASILFFIGSALLIAAAENTGLIIYETDFESLDTGLTQPYPGAPGQGGWYNAQAAADSYGEIAGEPAGQNRALHESAGINSPAHAQTFDVKALTPPDLSIYPLVRFSVRFMARTNDIASRNTYDSSLRVSGGPHPGYVIMEIALSAGNGPTREETGVNVDIIGFNGLDNNMALPLTVGRGLAWDQWHSAEVIIDQYSDRFVSVTVDEQTQDLGEYSLPRSYFEGEWLRGELMEILQAEIVPAHNIDAPTHDEIFWDDILITGKCGLTADLTGDCRVDVADLAVIASQWLAGT
jgi:hypothetical protein